MQEDEGGDGAVVIMGSWIEGVGKEGVPDFRVVKTGGHPEIGAKHRRSSACMRRKGDAKEVRDVGQESEDPWFCCFCFFLMIKSGHGTGVDDVIASCVCMHIAKLGARENVRHGRAEEHAAHASAGAAVRRRHTRAPASKQIAA